MREEFHLVKIRESLNELDEAVKAGLVERQRTVGFHTSAAAVDLLEILLHRKHLIAAGAAIKHDWFRSARQAEEKVPSNTPNRARILRLMLEIEEKRDGLCYGAPQGKEQVRRVYEKFLELMDIFEGLGVEIER